MEEKFENTNSLKERIRLLCERNGRISFAQVERSVGLCRNSINRWDKINPRPDAVLKVAKYFNVSVEYLLNGTENPESGNEQDEDTRLRAEIMKSIDGMSEVDLKTVLAMSKVIAERQKEKEKDER